MIFLMLTKHCQHLQYTHNTLFPGNFSNSKTGKVKSTFLFTKNSYLQKMNINQLINLK